jgi:hypothetical protein
MLLILVAFSGLVGQVAMPILAGVLIYAAIGSLRLHDIGAIWRTGYVSQVALVTTFIATLLLPVTAAVGVGVALSLILQLNKEAMDLRVVQLDLRDEGQVVDLLDLGLERAHVVGLSMGGFATLLYGVIQAGDDLDRAGPAGLFLVAVIGLALILYTGYRWLNKLEETPKPSSG